MAAAGFRQHAEALAEGIRKAQKRTRSGGLALDRAADTSGLEDEEEYALKKRLAATAKAAQLLSQPAVARDSKSSRREVLSELMIQNTRSFLHTIQHDDMNRADEILYKQDGFDKNMPLPISAEAETLEALERMVGTLQEITGLALDDVQRTRLPSVQHTAWEVSGRALGCEAGAAARDGRAAGPSFTASFRVSEHDSSVSELRISLPKAAARDLGEVLVFCEERNCLRTFCTCLSQYGDLYSTREAVFRKVVEKHPDSATILDEVPPELPHEQLGGVLELRGQGGARAWAIWHPQFTFQNVSEASSGAAGYSIRTRVELWRQRSAEVDARRDDQFDMLVRAEGLSGGLMALADAMCGKGRV